MEDAKACPTDIHQSKREAFQIKVEAMLRVGVDAVINAAVLPLILHNLTREGNRRVSDELRFVLLQQVVWNE